MAEQKLTNSTHPSEFRLEQFALDELPEGEVRDGIETHVEACISCRAGLKSMREGFAAMPEIDAGALFDSISAADSNALSVDDSKEEPASRGKQRSWLPWLMPAVAAAAALLFVAWPKDNPNSNEALRLKGGVSLHVDRSVGQGSAEQMSGDVLHEGDRIRFRVSGTLGDAMHVMVFGIEDGGKRTVYYPRGTDASALAAPGPQGELRGAILLDSFVGREVLYLVACPSAFQMVDVISEEQAPIAPPNCQMDPFIMIKE